MHRVVPLAVLCSCVAEPALERHAPTDPGAVAAETALVVVHLHPDGSLDIGTISPRPIPFRERGPRFDQQRHGARPTPPTSNPTNPPGSINDPGLPGIDAPTPALPTHGPYAIVVRHQSSDPIVVPVDLGHPGEGGGDVLDRWQDGSIILHAPYLGAGTSYTVVRMAAEPTVALAETEVRP